LTIFFQTNKAQGVVQTNVPALKDVYAHDFYIGCLLSYRHVGFTTDPVVPGQSAVVAPQGGDLIKYHMNSMTPGNNMKSTYTIDIAGSASAYAAASDNTVRDSIEVHPIVKFNSDLIAQLDWAKRQGFTFRGHTLVWHSQSPAELFRSGYTASGAYLSKELMTKRMEYYIKEVIHLIHESWPGLLSAIDVVNEVINDGSSGSVRTTGNEWYTTFGDATYVLKAFEFARKYTTEYGETQIKLYYNDYNTHNSAKADGIVNLCQPIYNAGYLDGIGMQQHDANNSPTADAWIATYNKFYPICSEMAITELDIKTNSGTNTPSASILATQANQYAMLFKCFVERSYKSGRGKIINVSKDGLNDTYTFVTNESTSLWDTQNQCKPSFYAVAEVGKNYNELDTLITYTESLNQSQYSAQTWIAITNALTAAKSAKSMNYSPSNSAVTGLANAITNLRNALKGDSNDVPYTEGSTKTYAYVSNGSINIENIPNGGRLFVFSFTGALLHSYITNDANYSLPFNGPCIVRIVSDNEVIVLKVVQ
jgi:endo-1,4-beta-xylanase